MWTPHNKKVELCNDAGDDQRSSTKKGIIFQHPVLASFLVCSTTMMMTAAAATTSYYRENVCALENRSLSDLCIFST